MEQQGSRLCELWRRRRRTGGGAPPAGYGGAHGGDGPWSSDAVDVQRLRKFQDFQAEPEREAEVHRMLDELVAWGRALKPVRSQPRVELAAARA